MKNIDNNQKDIKPTPGDFEFVQMDESIHDKKFDTKPTTYLKDALKRFLKNRSSVVASVILFTLIAMAIIVPVANKSNIDSPNNTIKYLPPKWFSSDMGGFMDGTKVVENAILDPNTNELPSDSTYKPYAVIGEIKTRVSYADQVDNAVLTYGKGGALSLNNVSGHVDSETNHYKFDDVGIVTKEIEFDLNSTYSYTVNIDYDYTVSNLFENSKLSANLSFVTTINNGTSEEELYIPLANVTDFDASSAYVEKFIGDVSFKATELKCEDISSKIKENSNFATASTAKGKLAIILEGQKGEVAANYKYANMLYIRSVEASANIPASFTWDDSTKVVATYGKSDSAFSTLKQDSLKVSIYHSVVTYGSFRYDCYGAVFGDVSDKEFTEAEIEDFVSRGWMTYDWNPEQGANKAPGEFKLTPEGEKYCPLREITSQTVTVIPGVASVRRVKGVFSIYRDMYMKGELSSCEPPKYFFGTESHGYDFFKLVFSGLLTSLGLGLLSTVINIFVGLIWGAISGYFGGWVDLIMERFCEILGGMPWIVMMTLIVLLLGSNFWTFLLALCLTGWMGVAGETRSQFYRFKRREYVLASRTLGASDTRLIFKHILPNGIGTIITSCVLMIPSVIFTEANIAYLLPSALAFSGGQSFGVTLTNVQADLTLYPYLIVSGSIVMALIMICFNLFGNGLRDAFNPSLKGADE